MLYVSDHGESLGENDLFLHGLPYAIAPDVQKHVPMVAWLGDGIVRARTRLDRACLRRRPTSRSRTTTCSTRVLGLLDVTTPTFDPALDVWSACERHDEPELPSP